MIEIVINDAIYKGIENISINKDILNICNSFNISIESKEALNIKAGDKIIILENKKTFFVGYIDTYNIQITSNKSPLIISGRSLANDLVDSNITEFKQYTQLTPLSIIQDIIKDFNISVSTNLILDKLDFNINIGDTYFNAINKICKQYNILVISNKNGNIELVKNTKKQNNVILKDKDLLSINYSNDLSKQFSEYTYLKETTTKDVKNGTVKNDKISRHRPFVKINNQNKNNLDLAKWEKQNKEANSEKLTITLLNWDFDINTILQIDTQIIKNSYLIKSIDYSYSSTGGKISKLELINKELYI